MALGLASFDESLHEVYLPGLDERLRENERLLMERWEGPFEWQVACWSYEPTTVDEPPEAVYVITADFVTTAVDIARVQFSMDHGCKAVYVDSR